MRTFENTVRNFYDVKKQVLVCAIDKTKLRLSPSAKHYQNPCSGHPHVYQDLSTHHDWPVEKTIVVFPIKMKENSKRTSGNALGQNKDLGAASQTLLTERKLCLGRRLGEAIIMIAWYSKFQFSPCKAKFSQIPVSTSKCFPDSGIRIPLHGPIQCIFQFFLG